MAHKAPKLTPDQLQKLKDPRYVIALPSVKKVVRRSDKR
mgnify:CR=1 FL=1